MSNSCGALDFLEGGTIKDADIISSNITNSRVSNSVIDACDIENLSSIDADSAKVVADAIAALTPDQLKALAEAIFAAMQNKPGVSPVSSEADKIPTTILGGREALMGKPDMLITTPDPNYVIPAYRV